MKKFSIKCNTCGSINIEVNLEQIGGVCEDGESETSKSVELKCKDCGESEEVLSE